MYVRTVTRKNRDGSAVRYVQLAHNYRDPDTGHSMSRVLYSFGREGEVDVEAVRRLVSSLCRLLPAEDAVAAQAAAVGSA